MLKFILLFFFSISCSYVMQRNWSQDFPGTTAPRILKFGTNFGNDILCKRQSASSCLSPLFVHFSFFSNNFFHKFLSSYERVFKVCIQLQSFEVYRVKENHAEIYFVFFPSLTPYVCKGKFVSKTSQELLHLGI